MINRINYKLALISFLFFSNSLFSCNTGTTTNKSIEPILKVKDTINPFLWKPIVYDSSKIYIYLTFDDGPQNGTATVFELCKKLGVKATFFMVGQHTAQKPDGKQIVSSILKSYPQFLVANHSYTHANGKYKYFYQHPQMAATDFFKTQESLNIPFKIIRLAGNSAWVRKGEIKASNLVKPVCILLDSAGYNIIGWDVEWSFNHTTANPIQTPEKMLAIVDNALAKNKTKTNHHIVILSHDRMFRNFNYTNSLATFITLLKRNPMYVFETVDHYPGLKFPQ